MTALPYFLVYLIPACAVTGLALGGAWHFLAFGFVFGLTPVLDVLLGLDTENPDDEEVAARGRNPLYKLSAWLMFPVLIEVVGYALTLASQGQWTGLEWLGAALSVGVTIGGCGITLAHELMHRPGKLDQGLAEALMTMATYPHFCTEHVHGHHKHVATPNDPGTSRFGESLYTFLPRTLIGSLRSAWRIERTRTARKDLRWWADRRLRYAADLALVYGVVGAAFGWRGVTFFAAQSVWAIIMVEAINFIEHYGLQRAEIAPGRYERTLPKHSWNSAHRMSQWYLFALPRHADHHHLASRPYWALRHIDDAPQMPAGYATMFLASFVPPLWRWLMDERVAAAEAGVAEARSAPAVQAELAA